MDDPYAIGRREFLKSGALAVAVASVGCGSPTGRWRVLSDSEAETLGAACNQIVPPDDFPGATEAGAIEFIDRQLATREKERLGFWQGGLRGLDAAARRRGGAPFHTLAFAEQTALLEAIERGEVDAAGWGDVEPRAFFNTLVSYTMMAFYGDPRHGGNRERVSWRMLGLPGPPVRGRHTTPEDRS
jgi:gluconate 2-dehydrogenase gamma chain